MLPDLERQITIDEFTKAVNQTISTIIELLDAAGVQEPSSLNLVFSDGINVIATRYRSGESQPPSLYYNYGYGFACVNYKIRSSRCMGSGRPASEIVIASAPLSHLGDGELCDPNEHRGKDSYNDVYGTWVLIPKDHMLVGEGDPSDLSKVTSVRMAPVQLSLAAQNALRRIRSNSAASLSTATLSAFHETVVAPPVQLTEAVRHPVVTAVEALVHDSPKRSLDMTEINMEVVFAFVGGMLTMVLAIILTKVIDV